MDISKVLTKIAAHPVIPVYYNDDPAVCLEVLKACYEGGIRVFEFVNRGDKAAENFQFLMDYKKIYLPDLFLGIGTIKNAAQAQQYVNSGADFIVSPIVDAKIADVTLARGKLWIPGCMTPTEIAVAESLGAPLVKLFPGDTLGPGFLKSIKPLFPELKFMPTGGVDVSEESLRSWFDAGVLAVGMGSKLFSAPTDATDYAWLSARVAHLFRIVSR